MIGVQENTISNNDNDIKEYIKCINKCINYSNDNWDIDRFCLENINIIEKSFNCLSSIYEFIDENFAKGFFRNRFDKEMINIINNNKNSFIEFSKFYKKFLKLMFSIYEENYNKKEQYKLIIDKNKDAIIKIYNSHHFVF